MEYTNTNIFYQILIGLKWETNASAFRVTKTFLMWFISWKRNLCICIDMQPGEEEETVRKSASQLIKSADATIVNLLQRATVLTIGTYAALLDLVIKRNISFCYFFFFSSPPSVSILTINPSRNVVVMFAELVIKIILRNNLFI